MDGFDSNQSEGYQIDAFHEGADVLLEERAVAALVETNTSIQGFVHDTMENTPSPSEGYREDSNANEVIAKQLVETALVTVALPMAATTAVTVLCNLMNELPNDIITSVLNTDENSETHVNTTAVTACSTVHSAAAPAFPTFSTTEKTEVTLSDMLNQYPVDVPQGQARDVDEIEKSIQGLDKLITALISLDSSKVSSGQAPGFDTRFSSGTWLKTKKVETPYEILLGLNESTCLSQIAASRFYVKSCTTTRVVPQPSPTTAVKYFLNIKKVWEEYKMYIEESSYEKSSEDQFCSCIREWNHSTGHVLIQIANQSLEQAMVREVSSCVTARMLQPGYIKGQVWDQMYEPQKCLLPENDNLYIKSTPIRLMKGRDDYIHMLTDMVMNATSSVDIATCYTFAHDPVQRYILLDLLPYVASRGVKVRLCIDLMTIESAIVKSAFIPKKKEDAKKKTRGGRDPSSFRDKLSAQCPPFEKAGLPYTSPLGFFQMILDAASSVPDGNYEIRYWCARDDKDGYRVKNHSKCAVIDLESKRSDDVYAFIGGSNLAPTVESGDSDCDVLVSGIVAQQVGGTFNYLWDALEVANPVNNTPSTLETNRGSVSHINNIPPVGDDIKRMNNDWLDEEASIALVRSEPSSSGEDVVLRRVLGMIASAKSSVRICMGHVNFPRPIAIALNDACKRGVTAKLLVNSIYSSDLRVNERDMFLSLKELLEIAPDVEVWTTAMPEKRHKANQPENIPFEGENVAPPFVHAKYVVIDSIWCAVGSWNLWTRSAFHEIEHELLVESKTFALAMEGKFEKEREETSVRLFDPDECLPGGEWCPKGCNLCQQFGPFYIDMNGR